MKNKTLMVVLLLGSLALAIPTHSFAMSLGLITESPTLKASLAFIDYLEFGPDGDLSAFGAEVDFVDGVTPVGFTEIGFGFGFSLGAPTVGATGGFGIFDEDGLFLAGDLIAVGFLEDLIELQFGSLTGAGASSFGSSVVALLAFEDSLGADPFASLVDGEFYSASITVAKVSAVSAVPVPATLLLLLSGLLGIGWFGIRRGAK